MEEMEEGVKCLVDCPLDSQIEMTLYQPCKEAIQSSVLQIEPQGIARIDLCTLEEQATFSFWQSPVIIPSTWNFEITMIPIDID